MKQIFSVVLLVLLLTVSAASDVYATEVDGQEEMSEEEKRQEQLDAIYSMPVQSNEIAGWPQGPGTYDDAAIVMEAGTGVILYAKNIDAHFYPASITKVLTALVALENGKFEDPVVFSHDCVAFLQPGDSSVGLKEGDEITLEQALYATLLASANEAAYAVGENVGKNAGQDYDWFIDKMNARCRELGGENSHFVNTNGLHDPDHFTCARDMALIGCELFSHPEFFEIVQTHQYEIPASDTCEQHVFQQKHKMLNPDSSQYYEYAVGGKTGFTSDALNTLITMADNGETQLVCVVLHSQSGYHYKDTRALFDYAYQNFARTPVAGNETSEDVGEILEDEGGGYVMLPKGVEFADLEMELVPDDANDGKATLNYTYEGTFVGTARAKLSDQYINAHKAKIHELDADADVRNGQDRGMAEKAVLIGLCVVWVAMVILFVRMILQRKRQKKHRRH
ncbi:MAG TPA: D-alanyl-D-alanine carboxypeptidase [Candidatus Dorea merdavium]|nr:D-alanyl-D-alanine carboxypeptidase [Candidatus Dorea merdavium]